MTEKERLEKAREIYNNTNDVIVLHTLDELYPEFKETEDESIRKEIINFLELPHPQFVGKRDHEKWIAWLEKQGDKCLVNFDKAEQEKYDFVSGQYIECRASFNEFKEDNSYWFEYIGNDTYVGRSDNILNKKFHITPRQLFTLFTQQHCPKEDSNVNEETNAPTEYGKYVDECLNEASKHFFSNGEDAYSVADLFYAGVRCGKSWFEKQAEQKSSTEVKPKFKQGEWVVWKDKYYKVNYNGCGYELFDQNGLSTSWDYKTIEDNAHLWTIQDAKDGDMLAFNDGHGNDCIELIKSITGKKIEFWFCLTNGNRYEVFDGIIPYTNLVSREDATPATKEQRDILFEEMQKKGYTFDFEKKEMKKIEEKPADKIEPIFNIGDKIQYSRGCGTIFTIEKIENGNYIFANNMGHTTIESGNKFHLVEQKTTDKVEAMFNVGDYIKHNKANIICKVISVNSGSYYVENIETNSRIELFNAEQNFHLWTIEDAKEGDVLSYVTDEEDLWIMIYWSLYEPYEGHVHYHALLVNDNFSDKGTCCICINDLKPATKEQRDLLFQKMKEAGYEWDAEKKESKEIKKTSKWTEEDEETLEWLCRFLEKFGNEFYGGNEVNVISWLKTLNPKSYWKPTEEQLDALMDAIQGFYACKEKNLLLDLYEQLKELKNE